MHRTAPRHRTWGLMAAATLASSAAATLAPLCDPWGQWQSIAVCTAAVLASELLSSTGFADVGESGLVACLQFGMITLLPPGLFLPGPWAFAMPMSDPRGLTLRLIVDAAYATAILLLLVAGIRVVGWFRSRRFEGPARLATGSR